MAFDRGAHDDWYERGGPPPYDDSSMPSCPTDTISSIKFSQKGILSATSWANDVRCWKIEPDGFGKLVARTELATPIISSDWSSDSRYLFFGSCDVSLYMWNPMNPHEPEVLGKHKDGVKCTKWASEHDQLVSGSWDGTIKTWDVRSKKLIEEVVLSDRVYTLDVLGDVMVVYTADNEIHQHDMRKLTIPVRMSKSPINHQSRCVCLFPDQSGYALGSIEGRVAIYHLAPDLHNKNFKFKCHRQADHVYSINQISFHSEYGTFATCGSDGGYTFWDKDSKQRLRRFKTMDDAITDCCFSPDNSLFAYSVGYDWSRGSEYFKPDEQNVRLFVKNVKDTDIRPKQRRLWH